MSKRFTDTSKWAKSNFRTLPPKLKLAWMYLCDNCDHAGIWDVDMDLMSFQIGEKITLKELIESFSESITPHGDRLIIDAFIDFQYGTLNPDNRVHKSVIDRVEKIKNKPLTSPLQGAKDKDKDKDKDKEISNAPQKTLGSLIFDSYSMAFSARYGVEPPRNKDLNRWCKQICEKIGTDGIEVVNFFVRHNDAWYLKHQHSLQWCASHAESLFTQWKRNQPVTNAQVRQYEKQSGNMELLERVKKGEA